MKKMGLHEIRKEFLDFFKEKEHLVASSFSLVPKNDKSLLLIGAGMAPLKKYFTGEQTPPNKRMATCQKCIRTGDIDNVGKTDRHATFFEMLGNFSFGDYFKREATAWAWEFLTERMGISKEDLWVTIYLEDDEAFEIWNKEVGVPVERIVRLGKEDNFWELEVGPSGPCSEIYVDRGEKHGCGSPNCKPGCECDRFIEVWNLVFTQFDKDENGVYHSLPNPNIDTGMGLERITCVMEGTKTIFDTEAIREIIKKVEEAAKVKYGNDSKKDESIRVITDHSRAMTFLVSDGVLPSNEGRGYVLRRLIRRAARHGKLLGIEEEFLSQIVDVVINSWKVEYPEIKEREEQIKKVIKAEEDKFQETIHQGISILEEYIEEIKLNNQNILSGEKAFKLYDTYGFPLDLTKEILEEKNLQVDENEFNANMEEQRNRARKARDEGDSGWATGNEQDLFEGLETTFVGYEKTSIVSEIIGLFTNNEKVDKLKTEEEGIIILNESPFYGESGGQVGDTGIIEGSDFKAIVLDTKHSKGNHLIHIVRIIDGVAKVGTKVIASVDDNRRDSIRRNHSATHLLHRALKDVLGEHVNQAGSIVMPNRLRFDFTHFEGVTKEELKDIEKIVNSKILESLEVITIETSLKNAQEMGVVGLFEDKYKDEVRVLTMGDYSKELCGGTHVSNTANIGLFKILSESSIASGVRRIEAITGGSVYEYMNNMEDSIGELADILKTNKNNLLEKARTLVDEAKEKEKEIDSLKAKMASSIADEILSSKLVVSEVPTIVYKVDNMDMNSLRNLGDEIKNRLGSGVVVLASVKDDKISFVGMVTKDIIEKGIHAGNIIKEVAMKTGGGGGGRADMAQAGGKDINKVDEALSIVPNLIKEQAR
ncbi:alanyl-tRNA synthetase [Tissierella praeacuta DSM 18095]|uniref:Alanine--tRNA ligase n=3 Tax=Tissierella praeacuta TaxID=43131 RepID=A0A1M4SB13_9FIRM|nr:alanine--tRNA ligase [Tissierella praeacuta]TCU72933.1 alanyl-tRNA synthetase [Tissierella praeacuta]SHE29237.1 alanyl-tRNA synthetase [Tissierella praeacuta DSM 18095]SUP01205.1 Alanine--tRNA ligase [Tissierella praeacuta]